MDSSLIDFATEADLPAMATLLGELFTLESDFFADRDKQVAGLRLILENPALGRLFVLRVNGGWQGWPTRLSP